jgi:hypothetical protein
MNHKGFTMIEALAGFVILVLVVSLSFSILIQSRKQSKMNQDYLLSHQVGLMLSNYVTRYFYEETHREAIGLFLGEEQERIINQDNCKDFFDSSFCEYLFEVSINHELYNDQRVIIKVHAPILSIVKIEISVVYATHKFSTNEVLIYV